MTALTVDFTPASLDIYIDQGDNFNKIVTLKDSDGNLIDLTGFTFAANLRQYYNSTKDFSLSVEVYGTPVNGQLRLFMTNAATTLLTAPRYVYSVRATSGSTVIRVLDGQVLITPVA